MCGTRRSRDTNVKTSVTISLLALTLASCSGDAERRLVAQFFAASRLRDLTALRNLSTVVFEPSTDGIVTTFELLSVSAGSGSGAQPKSEDVLIAALVRMPDGRTASKRFVVTMQWGWPDSEQRWGGWMITAIKDAPASPSTPPS